MTFKLVAAMSALCLLTACAGSSARVVRTVSPLPPQYDANVDLAVLSGLELVHTSLIQADADARNRKVIEKGPIAENIRAIDLQYTEVFAQYREYHEHSSLAPGTTEINQRLAALQINVAGLIQVIRQTE